jgi:hypothetical protein
MPQDQIPNDKRIPLSDGHELPDWALTYVDAAIRIGQKAIDIQTTLIAKGLPVSLVAMVIDKSYELRLAAEQQARRRVTRYKTVSRVVSLIVAIAIMLAATFDGDFKGLNEVILRAATLMFPLAFIWFSDLLGNYVSPYGFGPRRPTPGFFVGLAGWLMLVGPPVVRLMFFAKL